METRHNTDTVIDGKEPLEHYHVQISDREIALYAQYDGPGPIACAYHLSHARKEWGHAARFPQYREFHLSIVERDLQWFDLRLKEYEYASEGRSAGVND